MRSKQTLAAGLALMGTHVLLTGCSSKSAPNAEGAKEDSAASVATQNTGAAPSAGASAKQMRSFSAHPLADYEKKNAAPLAQEAAQNKQFYAAAPSPVAHDSLAAPKPQETYNPNMYVSNTYLGGNGEKDRLEKLITAGVVVDGRRVKLEAFSRSYAQTFPIPTRTALSLVADTERSKIITSGEHTFLQVGLQAIKGEAPRRAPLNVALVIDRSGSMGSENKLEYAKAAAQKLVATLGPNDTFSLVSFDNDVNVLVPSQHVANKAAIAAKIARLAPGGGTNIYDGLKAGYAELARFSSPETVNRVILLSDGQVTAGVSDPEAFHRLVAKQVDSDIQTTAVGVGVQFNENLMLALARDGQGNYHFLKDGADTQRVFAKELDELTHTVAKAVKLRIKLADGVGLVRVLGAQTLDTKATQAVRAEEKRMDRKVAEELGITSDRQNAPDEPGIKTLIPNFYRGDSHVVMLELAVPPGTGQHKLADVYLKYKDLISRANRETQASASIDYTPNRAEMITSIRRGVKKNLLGFQTGEALRDAAALISQGQVPEAVRRIDERMTVLGVAAREWHDTDLDGDGRLLDRYKSVLAQLNRNPQLAQGDLGQYLSRSLTYNGYNMTR